MQAFDYRPRPISLTRRLGHRVAIPLAIALAIGARLALPPVPVEANPADPVIADGMAEPRAIGQGNTEDRTVADLPTRAAQRPQPRPALPTGLALMVDPVMVSPLPVPPGR